MKLSLIHSTKDVSFLNILTYPEINIEKNKFSFITGKSGSGKSSYLKLLNKSTISSNGIISYDGVDIKELPVISYRKKVLLVPQQVFLINGTIKNNFDFYYETSEREKLTDNEILKFLEICCINFSVDTKCKSLSGGERQRIFLAIFLSTKPEVLLLDEPTAALDEKTSIQLLHNIKSFCKEEDITTVCVCHNDTLVEMFSDNTIRLGDF